MTELIKRDLVIDKLKQGYFDKNLQQAKNDPCVIDAMIDWSIRQVKDIPIVAEIPNEHGNLKDSQVILDLIYKHSSFPNVDVLWIENLIKDAPTVLEAST